MPLCQALPAILTTNDEGPYRTSSKKFAAVLHWDARALQVSDSGHRRCDQCDVDHLASLDLRNLAALGYLCGQRFKEKCRIAVK